MFDTADGASYWVPRRRSRRDELRRDELRRDGGDRHEGPVDGIAIAVDGSASLAGRRRHHRPVPDGVEAAVGDDGSPGRDTPLIKTHQAPWRAVAHPGGGCPGHGAAG